MYGRKSAKDWSGFNVFHDKSKGNSSYEILTECAELMKKLVMDGHFVRIKGQLKHLHPHETKCKTRIESLHRFKLLLLSGWNNYHTSTHDIKSPDMTLMLIVSVPKLKLPSFTHC